MSEPKFRVIVRGASSQPLLAEYMCPVHGRFDAIVDRDANGDPPKSVACPMVDDLLDLDREPVACGLEAEHVISAISGHVKRGEVTRGRNDEKPTPLALDTEALADGMPLKEWKARRQAMWRAHDYAEFKKNVG